MDHSTRRVALALATLILLGLLAWWWSMTGAARPAGPNAAPETPSDTPASATAPQGGGVPPTSDIERISAEPPASTSTSATDSQDPLLVRVVDHDGNPIAGVGVLVGGGTWAMETGVTALDGVASFTGHGRGTIRAEVDAKTLAPEYAVPGRVNRSLSNGDSATLTLVCPLAGTLIGSVCRANGEPVAGVRVRLHGIDHDADSRVLWTDADGRFLIDRVHPGIWEAAIRVDDRRLWIGGHLPASQQCQVPHGGTATIELRCPADGLWLHGRVIDQHQRPVAGILVSAGAPYTVEGEPVATLGGQASAFAVTDAFGTWRLGPLEARPQAVQVGDRHAAEGVTRDAALFTEWPEGFLARPGDGIDHMTSVEVVHDVITWRIRPQLAPAFARQTGLDASDLRAKVGGWCRLFLDEHGTWTLRTDRRGRDRLFIVSAGDREWRINLPEPAAGLADIELAIPPP